GTPLIEVSLPDVPDPSERKTILQEICSSCIEEEKQRRSMQILDRTQMLNSMRIKVEFTLKNLVTDMREKAIALNAAGGAVGRVGFMEMELNRLVPELVDAQLNAVKSRNEL